MTMTPRRIVAVSLLAVGLLVAGPATSWAQSAKDRARVLFREGNALLDRKDFEGALEKFREAGKLFPSYKIDLNIGSTLYAMGRFEEAAEYYDTFLRKGLESAPPEILKAAREKLDEVKTKVAALTLTAQVDGARVEVNARQVGVTPLPGKLYVKPGRCQVSVTKQGFEPFLAALSLSAGEARTVEAELKPKPVAVVTPPPPRPVEPVAPAPAPPAAPTDPGRWKKLAGWIALGVGGAGLITGAIFGGLTASAAADYADEQNKDFGQWAPDHDAKLKALEEDHSQYKTLTVVGLVTGGVIAAAGGGLLLWYYLGDGKRGGERAAYVVPYFGDGGGGIVAGARF